MHADQPFIKVWELKPEVALCLEMLYKRLGYEQTSLYIVTCPKALPFLPMELVSVSTAIRNIYSLYSKNKIDIFWLK